jgi:hypothetical protein
MVFSAIASKLSSSLMGLLDDSLPKGRRETGVQEIRDAMFASLASRMQGDMRTHPIWNKLQYASTIQTLWYLRMELMTLLSVHCDEGVAQGELERITDLFQGLLPRNQTRGSRKPR